MLTQTKEDTNEKKIEKKIENKYIFKQTYTRIPFDAQNHNFIFFVDICILPSDTTEIENISNVYSPNFFGHLKN